jgi:Fe-S oxidoreductase
MDMADAESSHAPTIVSELFREVEILKSLLLKPQDRTWLEIPPDNPRPVNTVLYLGCNVLRTPHLAQTAVAVLQRMGEDFVALGGTAFCCGVPWQMGGAEGEALNRGEKLTSQLQLFQPKNVLIWCPSCLHFCHETLKLSDSFELCQMAEYLAENRNRLSLEPQPAARMALHHHTGSPAADEHAAAVRDLLSAVPGYEFLEIGSSDAFGRACFGGLRDEMGEEAWEALTASFLQKASDSQADVFATIYHSCHRMFAGYQNRYNFTIEHYLTLLARALGINYPDKYKEYSLWKDRDRILEDARPCLEANRIEIDAAAATIDRVFIQEGGL